MGKKAHGLDYCEDCRKIMLLLINPTKQFNRFNSLLRKCQETIDPKYSAPRLQRHLKGLEGEGMIKREKKGKYHTTFSTAIPKDLIEKSKSLLIEEIEKLKTSPLQYLFNIKLNFFRFLCIEQTKIDLEELLGKTTPEETRLKRTWMNYLTWSKMKEFDQAMLNRSEAEYIEALNVLRSYKINGGV